MPYGNSSCFLLLLVFGTRPSSHTKISFKLEIVEKTNGGLLSSGSAFHGAAGAQVSSQSGRTWPYIREHHILCNASRANSPGQSDPEQGEKQSEICFATTKTSVISLSQLSLSLLPSLSPLPSTSTLWDAVARGEGGHEHEESLGRWKSVSRP